MASPHSSAAHFVHVIVTHSLDSTASDIDSRSRDGIKILDFGKFLDKISNYAIGRLKISTTILPIPVVRRAPMRRDSSMG